MDRESPHGVYKNEIDYVLTNRSNLFEDCRNVKHTNFNTNHRMVRARLTVKQSNKRRPFNINKQTRIVEESTKIELKSKLEDFLQTAKNLDLQEKYDKRSSQQNGETKYKQRKKTKTYNVRPRKTTN